MASALTAPPSAADVRVSQNFVLAPGSRIHGRDALGLAVNPRDPNHIVGVWADWVSGACEVGVTRNAGQSWRRAQLQAPGGFVSPPCSANPQLTGQLAQSIAFGRGNAIYTTFSTAQRHAPGGAVVLATSRSGGASWRTTKVAHVRGYAHAQPPVAAHHTFSAGTFPRLAADRRRGRVYLAYSAVAPTVPGTARAADHFIHPDIDVYFQASRDAGATWTAPRRLNGEPRISAEPLSQTRHPNLSVAPNGRLDVVWHDRRHWYRGCQDADRTCDEGRLGDTYYRYSTDGGRTFSIERRISDRSINNVGYDYRLGTYSENGPVVVARGSRRSLIGWMDSRFGAFGTDTQSLLIAEVDHRAPRRVPVQRLRPRSPAQLAVALSQLAFPGGGESVLGGRGVARSFTRVVVVNESDTAGALAGAVLARAFLGPVLVGDRDGLSAATRAEIGRLKPVGAFVLGGEDVLSANVVAQLADAGVPRDHVSRLAAGDAAGTAALVAAAADRRSEAQRAAGDPAFDAAILVNPRSRDAYAVATLAASRRLPVLFAGSDGLPAATLDALRSLSIRRTLIVGSPRQIAPRVAAQVLGPKRLGGADAIRTSLAVTRESAARGVPANVLYAISTDHSLCSALTGATGGRAGGVLQLTGATGGRAGGLQLTGTTGERAGGVLQLTGATGGRAGGVIQGIVALDKRHGVGRIISVEPR